MVKVKALVIYLLLKLIFYCHNQTELGFGNLWWKYLLNRANQPYFSNIFFQILGFKPKLTRIVSYNEIKVLVEDFILGHFIPPKNATVLK